MNGRTRIFGGLLAGVAACLLVPSAASAMDCGLPGSADATMTNTALDVQGDIDASRTGGYLQIPFTVPAATKAIRVRYSYDNQNDTCSGEQHNTLDMGVYQPRANPSDPIWQQVDRRGWSGSAVKDLAIAENGFTDAAVYNSSRKAYVTGNTTRAYRPGPIQAGEWAVELGIAYVDPADADGIHYHLQIQTSTDGSTWADHPYSPSGPPALSVNTTPGWYTGDLHVHGEMEPGNATMSETFDAAFGSGGAGLDFITLVDHNNNIAHNDMKTQADVYPDNLVIPGTEVTTYRGHWNNQGSSNFADFRTGPVYGVTPDAVVDTFTDADITKERDPVPPKDEFAHAQAGGGWTQINHPATFKDDPAGCRGCAWTYSDADTDFSKVDAIEVHNSFGPLSSGPFTLDAIAYYEHALDSGAHIAAIGSSDAHKAATDPISHVGEGVTVVGADGLNKQAIIDGVKADHTYVKPWGASGPDLSLTAKSPEGDEGTIGDTVAGHSLKLKATVSGADLTGRAGDWSLALMKDGSAINTVPFTGSGTVHTLKVKAEGRYSMKVIRSTNGTDFIEDYSSPIWFDKTPAPDNHFTVRRAKKKPNGVTILPVKVPGPGKLRLKGAAIATRHASPGEAATVKLKVSLTGKKKLERLERRGKLRVRTRIRYQPTGGKARVRKARVQVVSGA